MSDLFLDSNTVFGLLALMYTVFVELCHRKLAVPITPQ